MKIRVLYIQVGMISLNPINGWDAEVPTDLYNEYMTAFRKMDEALVNLSDYLLPQAERADGKMEQHLIRKGLTLLKPETA